MRKRASALGISFAEYVRRGDSPRFVDVSVIFDLGSSRQPTNVGENKQRMLDEAVSADRLRKTRRGPVDPPYF